MGCDLSNHTAGIITRLLKFTVLGGLFLVVIMPFKTPVFPNLQVGREPDFYLGMRSYQWEWAVNIKQRNLTIGTQQT